MTHRWTSSLEAVGRALSSCSSVGILLVGLDLLAGCGAGTTEGGQPKGAGTDARVAQPIRLVAFVGAASKPPMEEAKQAFEKANPSIKVDMTFGGSGTLLNQMTLEETGDIYMPGSDDYMDKAEAKQAVIPGTRTIVAYLIPSICVREGNPKNIRGLKDLTRPGLTVGLAQAEAVCLGDISEEILRSAGIEEQVKKNVITYARSCDNTQQLIMLGEVDAIIGWRVFAAWCPDQIDCVDIPSKHMRVRNIPAAVSVYSEQREAARQFIDFLASEEGKAIFERHGYHVTPPEV